MPYTNVHGQEIDDSPATLEELRAVASHASGLYLCPRCGAALDCTDSETVEESICYWYQCQGGPPCGFEVKQWCSIVPDELMSVAHGGEEESVQLDPDGSLAEKPRSAPLPCCGQLSGFGHASNCVHYKHPHRPRPGDYPQSGASVSTT